MLTALFMIPALLCAEPVDWLQKRIEQKEAEKVANPPSRIEKYIYKGKTVYYFPPECCDQYSQLLDENGNKICSPDGGMAGDGDGKCRDFFELRTDREVVWADSRPR